MTLSIFLEDLATHNNGETRGQWISLPMEEEDLEEKIKEIVTSEEYIILDTDSEYKINFYQYESPYEYNRQAQMLEDLEEEHGEDAKELIQGLLEDGEQLDEIKNILKYGYSSYGDAEAIGQYYAEEVLNLDNNLKSYFDFEAFGEDILNDGQRFVYTKNYIFLIHE
jgi:antirestriction protein